jgi:hypothetical protein
MYWSTNRVLPVAVFFRHPQFVVHRRMSSSNTPTTTVTTTTSPSTTTQSHYETHSALKSYDSAYFYEIGPYMNHLRDLCSHRLQLKNRNNSTGSSNSHEKRILLDIGGGTGTFTRTLLDGTDHCDAIVIDPFLEENSSHSSDSYSNSNVRFIKASAEAFIKHDVEPNPTTTTTTTSATITANDELFTMLPKQYHQILLKEVVHHFSDQDRIPIFRGMYNSGLIPTSMYIPTTFASTTTTMVPSILIITRPQYEIDYPLWDAARAVWASHQPSVQQIMTELQMAGFQHITYTVESYPCSISLQRWQTMIQSRFWSTFTNFTDSELKEACSTIAINEQHRMTEDGTIHFEDRLLFITGCKIE